VSSAYAPLTALDAKTGKILWRAYTLPAPGEPAATRGRPAPLIIHARASIWNTRRSIRSSASSTLPSAIAAGLRRVDARRRQFVLRLDLAINAKTGAYAWHFQQVHHDIWDYDAASRSSSSTR